MERIYIDGDMAQFAPNDITTVDMTLADGTVFENVEPRRLFPTSNPEQYIALLDENGTEQAVIRDLNTLAPEQSQIIRQCLEEYYLIPRVTKIFESSDKFGLVILQTETDRGPVRIEIRNLLYGFKQRGNGLLLRDSNDNRYEIPDISRLDKHSRHMLENYF